MITPAYISDFTCELEFKYPDRKRKKIDIGYPVYTDGVAWYFQAQTVTETCILIARRLKGKNKRTIKLIKTNIPINALDNLYISFEIIK